MENYKEILQEVKNETEGYTGTIPVKDISLEVNEFINNETEKCERDAFVKFKGKVFPVTPRGYRNLLKLTGFSNSLFKSLPIEQLRKDLNSQIYRIPSVGMVLYKDRMHAIHSPIRGEFLPYGEILPSEDSLMALKGSPLKNDSITFLTQDQEVQGLKFGVWAEISSTGMVKTTFQYGVFRIACENSWVDSITDSRKYGAVDRDLVNQTLQYYYDNVENYTSVAGKFVERAKEYKIRLNGNGDNEFLDNILSRLSINAKCKQELRECIDNTEEGRGLLKRSGVEKVSNLWDVFNVLVRISNDLGYQYSKGMLKSVYKWTDNLINVPILN